MDNDNATVNKNIIGSPKMQNDFCCTIKWLMFYNISLFYCSYQSYLIYQVSCLYNRVKWNRNNKLCRRNEFPLYIFYEYMLERRNSVYVGVYFVEDVGAVA